MIRIIYTTFKKKLVEDEFSFHRNSLPPGIQEQIDRYKKWEDAQSVLLGKLLLKKAFSELQDPNYKLENLQYNEYKRPEIKGIYDFNISHSGNYVVCAITDQGRIGVDIEQMREMKYQEFARVFTDSELDFINAAENPQHRFFDYWTQKEAVIKADGRGMHLPLKDVIIQNEEVVRVYEKSWHLKPLSINADYRCHIACEGFPEEIEMREILF